MEKEQAIDALEPKTYEGLCRRCLWSDSDSRVYHGISTNDNFNRENDDNPLGLGGTLQFHSAWAV